MELSVEKRGDLAEELLNGTMAALKVVVPVPLMVDQIEEQTSHLELTYGVLIGFAGDIKGNLVIKGDREVFSKLGEKMFGMPLEGEMLLSFSGEFGNMLAGSLATFISHKGFETDITAPTVLQGNTYLSGHEKSICLPIRYDDIGKLDIYLMLKM